MPDNRGICFSRAFFFSLTVVCGFVGFSLASSFIGMFSIVVTLQHTFSFIDALLRQETRICLLRNEINDFAHRCILSALLQGHIEISSRFSYLHNIAIKGPRAIHLYLSGGWTRTTWIMYKNRFTFNFWEIFPYVPFAPRIYTFVTHT